jgi:hypothetical protein
MPERRFPPPWSVEETGAFPFPREDLIYIKRT